MVPFPKVRQVEAKREAWAPDRWPQEKFFPACPFRVWLLKYGRERLLLSPWVTILQLINAEISSFQLVNALLLPLCNILLWLKDAVFCLCVYWFGFVFVTVFFCFVLVMFLVLEENFFSETTVGRVLWIRFSWPWSYCAALFTPFI